jgi:Family of unknown function (DUF6173)
MTEQIATSAEAAENAILPALQEVHIDPLQAAPAAAGLAAADKSPARWAYERLIIYIRNFESQLDAAHEVAMGFTGGEAGVIRIEGIGYFDPDIVTFYGSDGEGTKTQVIQHVAQLNVMLRALPRMDVTQAPRRIGFQLGQAIDPKPKAP